MFGELFTKQWLVFPPFPLLDEVDDDEGAAVPFQQLVEVVAGGQRKRILEQEVLMVFRVL